MIVHGLVGDLVLPDDPAGLVVFAHGSGSSRRSPRNRAVAGTLNAAGFGTLLLDLLTEDEDERRFDIPLLAGRLEAVVDEMAEHDLPMGLFGASTGAAAALIAAARRNTVRAVVSRGGRPDLAAGDLAKVRAPTLLVVGGLDTPVIELNRRAAALITTARIEVVPGADHLFSQPGTLEQVARLATAWFGEHLRG
ncbi:dienelactone hydrolase family protein [Actinokineospora soli]|uniref:Dienelactone hydrolase family protein n=1 Tax=Actinokineospora soli TaxID=1048753 RepID=A0ABW2TLK7_9PSEU